MSERKFLPTLGDLLDRLSIHTLKYINLPEHQEQYGKEIEDIKHDIQLLLGKFPQPQITSEFLYDVIILAQYNLFIWTNEDPARDGEKSGNNLFLTHSLNGIRSMSVARMNKAAGDRAQHKVNCIAADAEMWRPHGY